MVNESESELERIIRQNIGESFVWENLSSYPRNEFTIIGESQEENNILIEWYDGTLESLPVSEYNNKIGYEINHISNAILD